MSGLEISSELKVLNVPGASNICNEDAEGQGAQGWRKFFGAPRYSHGYSTLPY